MENDPTCGEIMKLSYEVRRVPPDWVHPVDSQGKLTPLYNQAHVIAVLEWDLNCAKWLRGWRPEKWTGQQGSDIHCFEGCFGKRPQPEQYMPDWIPDWMAGKPTWYMLYKTSGTPYSPVLEHSWDLTQWINDNRAVALSDVNDEQWGELSSLIRRQSK